jgi:hypothetical protein
MLQKILAGATVMPLLLACAPFAQAGMQTMSPEQVSLVDNTCISAMGLKKGEYYFALCRESLAQALEVKSEGQDLAAAYRDCHKHEPQDSTAALSTCMLDTEARGTATRPIAVADASLSGAEPDTSFYHMPARKRIRQERYACAQLGLLPGSSAFGECFADLNTAMTSNPD